MENEEDKKKKDKQIPEVELFDELDAMYQRVADIEKEEATEILTREEGASSSTHGIRVAPEKPLKKKPGRNKKRSYRPMILGTIAILFALLLGITFWKPMSILQLLRIGDVQEPAVPPRPAPQKAPAVATPKAPPAPPIAATSPAPLKPPSAVATSPAPPKPTSESVPAQTRQEVMKSPNSLPRAKYFAIQVGSFRDMENVRGLVEVLKKEGLEAYWIASKSKKRGAFYRVLVGQFVDTNEATQFLRDKKIFKNYPDSFVQEISSSKITR
jgi:cell division septation protein DedD